MNCVTGSANGKNIKELGLMKLENITFEQFKDFVIVITALLAFIVLIGNVIKTVHEWTKPKSKEEEWKRSVDLKLDRDNRRIEHLEEGNKVKCRALMALLSHEINGNSNDKLQKALGDLNDYLIEG